MNKAKKTAQESQPSALEGEQRPKELTRQERRKQIRSGILWFCGGIGILILGIRGLYLGKLNIPIPGGGRVPGISLHGYPFWSLFLVYLCIAVFCITVAIDSFARQERNAFRRTVSSAAWKPGIFFFIAAIVLARVLGQ